MKYQNSLLLLAFAVVFGGISMSLVYGVEAGLLTAVLMLVSGAPVLTIAHLVEHRRLRLRSLSWNLGAGVAISIAVALGGIEVIALVLFVSAHDAFTMGLLLTFAGTLAAYSAWLIAKSVTRDIEAVRDTIVAVGEGDRDRRIDLNSEDELAELADAANLMTEQLAEGEARRDVAESARRDLTVAISHDLRTPLSSLQLVVEAMKDGLVEAHDRQHLVEQMSFHIKSMSTLIDDLFELSRLEAGEVDWPLEPVSLEELIEETVEGMQRRAAVKRVTLEASVEMPLAPALANPEKIQRVLFNLIENSIHHTPAGGNVTVSAEADGPNLAIEVADTGPGVPPQERVRIFEPFFRGGPDASRPRDGAGLGLPICRAIIEAHRGKIWLADAPTGTRMRVSLPAAAPH